MENEDSLMFDEKMPEWVHTYIILDDLWETANTCKEGRDWFKKNFPKGGTYLECEKKSEEDGKDSSWISQLYQVMKTAKERIEKSKKI